MLTTSFFVLSRQCAADLSAQVGNYHLNVDITSCFDAVVALFAATTGKAPRFRAHGGTNAENLALQNIQARFRMLFSYMLAQLLPWVRGRRGFLLVLGSSNARFPFHPHKPPCISSGGDKVGRRLFHAVCVRSPPQKQRGSGGIKAPSRPQRSALQARALCYACRLSAQRTNEYEEGVTILLLQAHQHPSPLPLD